MEARLSDEIKEYFKKFIECINLEQNAENERFSSSSMSKGASSNGREVKLRIVNIESN
jgi:hypothetical protein